MHVVLDARYISRRQSGVGAYAQRLITGLAAIDQVNHYTCLVAAEGPGLPVSQANIAAAPTRVSFEDHLRGDLLAPRVPAVPAARPPDGRLSRPGGVPPAREARLRHGGHHP